MTKYRFSDGAALVFGGSGGLGTGIVNLLAESGSDVAFTYFKNKESAESNLTNIQKIGRDGLVNSSEASFTNETTGDINSKSKSW